MSFGMCESYPRLYSPSKVRWARQGQKNNEKLSPQDVSVRQTLL